MTKKKAATPIMVWSEMDLKHARNRTIEEMEKEADVLRFTVSPTKNKEIFKVKVESLNNPSSSRTGLVRKDSLYLIVHDYDSVIANAKYMIQHEGDGFGTPYKWKSSPGDVLRVDMKKPFVDAKVEQEQCKRKLDSGDWENDKERQSLEKRLEKANMAVDRMEYDSNIVNIYIFNPRTLKESLPCGVGSPKLTSKNEEKSPKKMARV